jgi:hypothetical protein
MATYAGQRAPRTEDIYCEDCGSRLHVNAGDNIPKCPSCDNDSYNNVDFGEATPGQDRRPGGTGYDDEPL